MPSASARSRELLQRRLADPPGRDVDHPAERHVVLGVGHQVEVGQDVLDLLPLVERDPADDLIGDLGRAERLLEAPGQGRDPAEDGDVAIGVFPLADQLDDLRGDAVGLVGLGPVDGQLDGRRRRGSRSVRALGLRRRLWRIRVSATRRMFLVLR